MSTESIRRWINRVGALLQRRPKNRRNRANSNHLQLEQLEDRWLPSMVLPDFIIDHSAGQAQPMAGSGSYSGITPATMLTAYGITTTTGAYQVMFGSAAGNGAGQTIAIVDAYNQPNIVSDLTNFDNEFGLAAPPSFTMINETGGSTLPSNAPTSSGNWGVEISLDVEWAHAIAPAANIVLVEANTGNDSDLFAAVNAARNYAGVSVVSMSWTGSESSDDPSLDSNFTTPSDHIGVTFLAATGDGGEGVVYPAASPNVIAVGGTTLSTGSGGAWSSETGWTDSGGGISAYTSQPSYQNGVVAQSPTQRTVPDVAMDADPSSGVSVYDSYDEGSSTPWTDIGGTSLATPMWAGIIAIADQGRTLDGLGTLDGASATLPKLYALATPVSAAGYSSGAFHDITAGSNGNSAGVGYDLVTGIGSPVANVLIPDLIGATTTTLSDVGPNSSEYGAAINFTVNVATSGAAFTSGETVSLEDASNGNAVVGTGTLTNGSAAISISSLSAGLHDLFAVYNGDLLHAASRSNQVSQIVTAMPTTTTLTDDGPNVSTTGQAVSLTISVSPAVPDNETVSLIDTSNGNANIGSGTLSGGTATIWVSNLGAGEHVIDAVYPGDAGYSGSTSSTITQVVNGAPVVTTEPSDQSVINGNPATFAAAAGGYPTPTVQWQFSADDGASFTAIAGATATTLNLGNVSPSMNGYEYEAVFTNVVGSATTNPAMLTVDYVTVQPGGQTINAGQSAVFTAASANPSGADTVQWQVNTGSGFTNLSDGGVYSGSATTNLTISGASADMSGYQYDAVFTNSTGRLTTNAAILTVNAPVTLAGPPVVNGSRAVINIVSASGDGATATITTDGTPHGFWVGELVTLTGTVPGGPGGLAGTVTVTGVPSATTFQFASTYSGSQTLSGATVKAALAGAQRSMVDSIVYNFTAPVNLTAAAFSISVIVNNTTTGNEVGVAPTLNVAPVPFTNEWVVTFTDPVNHSVIGNSIANGAYSITINPSSATALSISPAAGQSYLSTAETDTFYRLYGDVYGTQAVTNVDANALNRAFGNYAYQTAYIAALDYNDQGRFTNVDINAFNRAFNTRYKVATTI